MFDKQGNWDMTQWHLVLTFRPLLNILGSGKISLQSCVCVCNCNISIQTAADVVAMGTDAAVMQSASHRDMGRLYYYTVSKIIGYLNVQNWAWQCKLRAAAEWPPH